jgi:hypothetical protein
MNKKEFISAHKAAAKTVFEAARRLAKSVASETYNVTICINIRKEGGKVNLMEQIIDFYLASKTTTDSLSDLMFAIIDNPLDSRVCVRIEKPKNSDSLREATGRYVFVSPPCMFDSERTYHITDDFCDKEGVYSACASLLWWDYSEH